jgi:cobalt-zinc-cadmium efflux system membrane fusion protein
VTFAVDAYPDRVFEGTVEGVGGWIEPDARTAEVRVIVSNADHALKPNMFAHGSLGIEAVGTSEVGIVLPVDAVQDVEGVPVVFVEIEPGRFDVRPVTVATRSGDQTLIAAGVERGERVVVEGAFALRSELEKSELGEGHAH